jgi:serine/threonine protein phosphatase PrpC
MKTQENLKKLQSENFEIILYETQGKRSAMEDFSDFQAPFTASATSLLLSVFDGHVGPRCAAFLANSLAIELKKEIGNSMLPSEANIKKMCKNLDQNWLEMARQKEGRLEDGSTALCVALEGGEMIIANCGDCRAILSEAGQTHALTRDHKPTDDAELQRIIGQGGAVVGGRVQGKLAVSRAFGNLSFKESQILTAEPEIHRVSLSPDVEYLVVGSDGLYEQFSNEEVISYIKTGLLSQNLETVVKELVEEAIDRGVDDNITIIVVKFEKAFKKLLKKRVKKQLGKAANGVIVKKNGKSSVLDSPRAENSKIALFKKGLKTTAKGSPSSPVERGDHPLALTKKKTEPHKPKSPISEKSFKIPPDDEKWNRAFKPFKTIDFFGNRTPVTISG